ncbi:hypothetical protein CA850_27225 [Micromonospora echinospora]|uniref:Phosphopantetheine attachment site n=1 Tax=Micromonospora echinospora TaxID=1877 RepID=A0A1C4WK96_MICEC|nr:phosphopantetheine-binding protein [Micromonospora echinospora]OZV76396.1 hypothetical protein CA850_27225 [Micromonospora echinospora]SCE96630.1 Phosphopantetheine attachment site [Micromonospora echinospora]
MTAQLSDQILAVFRVVLKNPSMSAEDDFFESGGDSTAAVDAAAMINQQTGVAVPIAQMFIYPTAEELAEALSSLSA